MTGILFTNRTNILRIVILGFEMLLLMIEFGSSPSRASAASGVLFSYQDVGYTVSYQFTPQTGTLNDLKVKYNDSFEFLPSNFGGIGTFVLNGETLRPWEGRHTSTLLAEGYTGNVYSARFRWSYQNDSLDFIIRLWLDKHTLVIEFDSYDAKVAEFGFDRSEQTPDPKVLELPYGHPVLFSNGVFISALADRLISNATTSYPQYEIYSTSSARYGYGGEYMSLTDGRRNSLHERVYLTVSPQIEDVFAQVNNPVSPYRAQLADKVVVDLWRNFAEYKSDLQTLANSGMSDLFVLLHVWQKYGYDNGLPSTLPAGDSFGGSNALIDVMHLCQLNQTLCALHTNYVDFYHNSDVWDANGKDIALKSDGSWVTAWWNPSTNIQSYLMKPSRALDYAKLYEPDIHRTYQTRAAYLDVHSAVHPSDKVDLDARVLDAGKQSSTYRSYQQILAYARSIHEGPVAGEGFGSSTNLWAGYVDAIEADPRSNGSFNIGGTEIPTIVDFKLLRLHNLFVPHGVGYLERFYLNKESYTTEELDRYRATEIAFGNAGFLSNPFGKGIPLAESKREYCFLKHIQHYYFMEQPLEIRYKIGDQLLGLSDALHIALPNIPAQQINSRLSEELGLLKVSYTGGFDVYVNRTKSKAWQLTVDNVSYVLRPNDFLARKNNEFLAYSAEVAGAKQDYICPAESMCSSCPKNKTQIHLPWVGK